MPTFQIKAIELYVRETRPGRMMFSLGKQESESATQGKAATGGLINPLGHVRLILQSSTGEEVFGCAADRLSVRWLDKRGDRSFDQKRRELVSLIQTVAAAITSFKEFETPWEFWRQTHPFTMQLGAEREQEELTSSFVSALYERAVLDAYCRYHQQPLFTMLKQGRLGFQAGELHPELLDFPFEESLPDLPLTKFWIRHTIGAEDPLRAVDLNDTNRANDGLPETLEEYIRTDGVRYFKVKVIGNPEADLRRLAAIWDVISHTETPVVSLDANEAYANLEDFEQFVDRFESELTGMFQHVAYIEQPLPRHLTLDPATAPAIRKLSEKKPLLIDEADMTVDAYRRALAIGYDGTSHKNCKGVFKSFTNHALMLLHAEQGRPTFMTAEDLQNLPVVPLQQDFTTLGILGIEDCERNGHHYNYGLSMLSPRDRQNALRNHPDLYERRGDEGFLKISDGQVSCASLQCPGFGILHEPDWPSMLPMQQWVEDRHPG